MYCSQNYYRQPAIAHCVEVENKAAELPRLLSCMNFAGNMQN
jgi:uncharacterized metal-binding protein